MDDESIVDSTQNGAASSDNAKNLDSKELDSSVSKYNLPLNSDNLKKLKPKSIMIREIVEITSFNTEIEKKSDKMLWSLSLVEG